MTTLIGLVLLSGLFYLTYRDARRASGGPHSRSMFVKDLHRLPGPDPDRLDLARLRRDMAAAPDLPDDAAPDTTPEADETALTHQLLAGTIERSVYQRLMSELAHTGSRPEDS